MNNLYKVCDNDIENVVASFRTVAEASAYIEGRIHEKQFKSYYWNVNELDFGLSIDYGSHNHFYYILNARIGDL